ncbi:hypothetical protein SAMN05216319_1765 [Duganella sp. CF402]|nr:hypothetical protein EV582_1863 [Duganella sp. BK701]SEL42635.1 hypothetical protein SAMN05216319_1765 [Duganella sp. CF402]
MWNTYVAPQFKIPLINADRMMMSILPETDQAGMIPRWATKLRDFDENWMKVAQKGVQSFVGQALIRKASFGVETVFSHWRDLGGGMVESKIDLIEEMQAAGYFVLLVFVGLSNAPLSIARVATRAARGGHSVSTSKLLSRTLCRVQIKEDEVYDRRDQRGTMPAPIAEWMNRVSPREAA